MYKKKITVFTLKSKKEQPIHIPDAGATKPVNQGFKGLGNQK